MTHELNSFLLQIGRIEGKLDVLLISIKEMTERMNRIDQDVEDVRKDIDIRLRKDVDQRIRYLENKVYTICLAAGFITTVLSGVIIKFLK